ncbi:MAG: ABC transporter substrate-binding protein [Thermodesulfobacteriota bacterium]
MNKRICFFLAWPLIVLGILCSADIHAADTVKIAAIFAKTGQAVVVPGLRPEFSAIQLAVTELNTSGGLLGRPIEVLEFDNQSTAIGSKQAAEEAVKAGVIAVIGATWSSHSLGMAPVLQANRIPMITPVSTNPAVTMVGDYIFRVCFIDDFQGEVMAAFAVTDLHAKTAVVLTNTGDKYSLGLAAFFMEKFNKLGGKILWEGDYLASTTDFSPQIQKTRGLKPDICFIPGYVRDTGYLIKQAKEMGVSSIFLSGDAMSNDIYRYAREYADGTLFSSHWHPEKADQRSRRFVTAYEKQYGQISDATPALTYDAVMLLFDAVKRAKSLEPSRIREALAKTRNFSGITGDITFDGNRNPVNKSAVILKFEHGASVYVKTVVP